MSEKKNEEALRISKMLDHSQLSLAGNLTIGRLLYNMNKLDSAYYYLNKALQSDNIYTKRGAYQVLFNLSKKQEDYKRNAEYSV